ncbi:uncharacterized protein LOC125034821 [Penaeus chinensis]|uniref:uncharacterized protein LOC125034821 n=1 Tax=Penaeus chinensis TaxID=139456 RepID=UPI001FB7CAC4|nr:uncharacterized protein LOC125034821 [Penaeus chinensis]
MGAKLQFLAAAGVAWWWWAAVAPASVSSINVYRSLDYSYMCYSLYPDNVTVATISRISCAATCSSQRCGLFGFEGGVCTLGSVGMVPADPQDTYLYVLADPSAARVSTPLPVIGKPAFGSSFWTSPRDLIPDLAVDGSEVNPSYYHSHPTVSNPWWVLDLQACHLVNEVQVQPKGGGGHTYHFKSVEIRVGMEFDSSLYTDTSSDFSSWALLGTYAGPPSTQDPVIFSSSTGLLGRYISIQRLETSTPYLVLTEVWVGTPDASRTPQLVRLMLA